MLAEVYGWIKRMSQIVTVDYSAVVTAVVSEVTPCMERTFLSTNWRRLPSQTASNATISHSSWSSVYVPHSGLIARAREKTLMYRWCSSLRYVLLKVPPAMQWWNWPSGRILGSDTQNIRKGEAVKQFSIWQKNRLNSTRCLHTPQYLLTTVKVALLYTSHSERFPAFTHFHLH
jgi:hypothetical protein